MPDHPSTEPAAATADGHLGLDELADLAVGELQADPAVGAAASAHLAACPVCRAEFVQVQADLDRMTSALRTLDLVTTSDTWTPDLSSSDRSATDLPVTVAARLDRVLAKESDARRGNVVPLRRPAPLKAPATASYVKQTGFLKIMLVAAAAAAVVGFGGYVVSASAGMNEPTAISPVQVQPDGLASQASELAEVRDPDPHLFSAAWRCARKVIDGRITGITPVYSEGEETYLVYTRAGGITYATLLYGCGSDTPTVGHSVRLTE